MLKRISGNRHLNKSLDVLRVTVHAVRQSRQVKSERAIIKNSTTSDTTARVVWIMSLLVLSAAMQTGSVNQRDRK